MTSNDYRIELYAQPLFWIVCVSLLVFMTSTEIARFGGNHDSSSILSTNSMYLLKIFIRHLQYVLKNTKEVIPRKMKLPEHQIIR